MAEMTLKPRAIPRTGDDTPAGSLPRYVLRMSGHHQIWISLLALFVAAISMAPLELQRRIIDDAIGNADLRLLATLSAIFLGILLVNGAAKFSLSMYQGWLSESAIRYNREHIAAIHAARRDTEGGKGQAVSIVGPEIDRLGGFVGEGLSQPVVNIGMLLAIMGYMLAVEPLIAAFSLIMLVPQAVAVPLVQRHINRLMEARVSMVRDLGDRIVELPGNGDDAPPNGLVEQLDGIYGNRMRILMLKFALKAGTNLLNAAAPLSVLAVGGYLVLQGETTIGVIVAFISGFDRLASPLRELMAYYRIAAQADVQHKMIADWMR